MSSYRELQYPAQHPRQLRLYRDKSPSYIFSRICTYIVTYSRHGRIQYCTRAYTPMAKLEQPKNLILSPLTAAPRYEHIHCKQYLSFPPILLYTCSCLCLFVSLFVDCRKYPRSVGFFSLSLTQLRSNPIGSEMERKEAADLCMAGKELQERRKDEGSQSERACFDQHNKSNSYNSYTIQYIYNVQIRTQIQYTQLQLYGDVFPRRM